MNIMGLPFQGYFINLKITLKVIKPEKKWLLDSKTRHSDLMVDKNILYLVYTRIGDKLESILYRVININ
tara:strand:+ start:260 stop:466 length:207 start_codon:yes stop_codon:yes gene_type:complete